MRPIRRKRRREFRPGLQPLEPRQVLNGDTDDQFAEASPLGNVNDAITEAIDVDMYAFLPQGGQTYRFDIDTATNGLSGLGSSLKLFDEEGVVLASNNDAQAPGEEPRPLLGGSNQDRFFDSYLEYTFLDLDISRARYYLGVSNWQNTGYDPISGEGDAVGQFHLTGPYALTVSVVPPVVAKMPDLDNLSSTEAALWIALLSEVPSPLSPGAFDASATTEAMSIIARALQNRLLRPDLFGNPASLFEILRAPGTIPGFATQGAGVALVDTDRRQRIIDLFEAVDTPPPGAELLLPETVVNHLAMARDVARRAAAGEELPDPFSASGGTFAWAASGSPAGPFVPIDAAGNTDVIAGVQFFTFANPYVTSIEVLRATRPPSAAGRATGLVIEFSQPLSPRLAGQSGLLRVVAAGRRRGQVLIGRVRVSDSFLIVRFAEPVPVGPGLTLILTRPGQIKDAEGRSLAGTTRFAGLV